MPGLALPVAPPHFYACMLLESVTVELHDLQFLCSEGIKRHS
jgi:hypothetical protein